jgi:hypothetical protein
MGMFQLVIYARAWAHSDFRAPVLLDVLALLAVTPVRDGDHQRRFRMRDRRQRPGAFQYAS